MTTDIAIFNRMLPPCGFKVLHFMRYNEVDSLVSNEDEDSNCSQRYLASKSITSHFAALADLSCNQFFQKCIKK